MLSSIRKNTFPPFFQLAEALDKTFASLNQPADYKELKGKDPSSVELLHKIEQVALKIQVKQKDLFASWLKNQTNLFRKLEVKVDLKKKKIHSDGFLPTFYVYMRVQTAQLLCVR